MTRFLRLSVVAALVAVALAYRGWYRRPQPSPLHQDWYRGVRYERSVSTEPRPVVTHLVRIDLREPGIEFVVTPPALSADGEVRSAPTSTFAAQQHVQLAINASYFYPFRNEHPLDYTPHPGDPVHVLGVTAARGATFGRPLEGQTTLYFSRTQEPSFSAPEGALWNAVSGMGYVVKDGKRADFRADEFTNVPYPRCLAALDRSGNELLLLVVDGKQPGYSEGLTLPEAADRLLGFGGWTGLQLDGGGSATLVHEVQSGAIELASRPANFKLPGWERSVATHFGVRAAPLR